MERWDLSTGLSKILLQIPEMETVGGARVVDGILTIVHRIDSRSESWDVSTWDAQAGEGFQREPLPGRAWILDRLHDHDIGISKDGTMLFAVNPHEVRTWSTLTGETTGVLAYRNPNRVLPPVSFDLDGPIIWIRSGERSPAQGWDLKNLNSPPLNSSKAPNRLRLICPHAGDGTRGNAGQCWIMDAISEIGVFQLPGKFANPSKVVWDSQYFAAVDDAGELLILDFVHMALP